MKGFITNDGLYDDNWSILMKCKMSLNRSNLEGGTYHRSNPYRMDLINTGLNRSKPNFGRHPSQSLNIPLRIIVEDENRVKRY